MGEKTTSRDPWLSRRRKLLLGSALSLAVMYAVLVHMNPLSYGTSITSKHQQSHQQLRYMPAAYGSTAVASLTAREADSALNLLREELDQLKAENTLLRSKQNDLLQAIERSLDQDQLASGLRDFLQSQEEATINGIPLLAPAPPAAKVEEAEKGDVQVAAAAVGGAAAAPGESMYFLLKNQDTGAYVEVDDYDWLHATGNALGPMAPRAFEAIAGPDGKYVLRSLGNGKFVRLVPPGHEPAWVYLADGQEPSGPTYIFELRANRFVYNPHSSAYMNVIAGPEGALRGHGNDPRKGQAAGQESSAQWVLEWVTPEAVEASRREAEEMAKWEALNDEELVKQIHVLPKSDEKRVISYGLYGNNPKYTNGAIRNAELVDTYFPGWDIRFYIDGTVPAKVVDALKALGAEIVRIEGMEGSIAGMFWRFLVADDPTVDRYIVRDSDSRLNARDRFAVEEWIRSKKSVHSIRDHVNHCRPLNGGLWGGVKGGIKGMTSRVQAWSRKSSYGEDLTFLNQDIWPSIKDDQISHDAYCCEQYPNAMPFPTKRSTTYQHVGQVFDANDQPRMDDINRFIKNKVIAPKCRRKPEWIYG